MLTGLSVSLYAAVWMILLAKLIFGWGCCGGVLIEVWDLSTSKNWGVREKQKRRARNGTRWLLPSRVVLCQKHSWIEGRRYARRSIIPLCGEILEAQDP